ncbi:MAG: MFS transporter [Gammaproteobacteria bacterium]|nr:MFS transporter [Gammaproteobacteria bacterium]
MKLQVITNAKVIAANTLGNTLDSYDYVLYGSLAPIIATNFFPSDNVYTSLILVYISFALGFVMRPLGGLLFGLYGDDIGRKKSLLASIVCMVIPTVLLGFVPSYSVIGMFAPITVVSRFGSRW